MKQEIFTSAEKKQLLARVPEIRHALLNNLYEFPQHPGKILLVGDIYPGIWLEHIQDDYFLTEYDPESAWNAVRGFLHFQREDGLFPFMLPIPGRWPGMDDPAEYWEIQSVWPLARCGWEIARKTNRSADDVRTLYQGAARFDDWMKRYRFNRETGLPELFCEWDTGHDNSPRVMDGNIPHACPGKDAVNRPDLPCMPILSTDLSAMLYGARTAMAEMAEFLGLPDEKTHWLDEAETLKRAIRRYLYDPEDDFYYDRGPEGFRKYRTEHITRFFLNGVSEPEEFERIFQRYFESENEFLTPFPYPSVSVSDPSYNREHPVNCWGGNTQALTSLRALLWLRAYGKEDVRRALLGKWLRAFLLHPETKFPQELHPETGAPIGEGMHYTPTLLLYLEGAKTL